MLYSLVMRVKFHPLDYAAGMTVTPICLVKLSQEFSLSLAGRSDIEAVLAAGGMPGFIRVFYFSLLYREEAIKQFDRNGSEIRTSRLIEFNP